MKTPEIPSNERERIAALDSLNVLDTPPEADFDAITSLAAHLLEVPIALVSLVDVDRQWFKSHCGLEVTETPRDVSFCGHVVAGGDLMVVPDAQEDRRFFDNPLVTGAPHVRFYAGVPLVMTDGFVVGTLCVIDHRPRELSALQITLFQGLARQVVAQLELRRQSKLAREGQVVRSVLENTPMMVAFWDRDQVCRFANRAYETWFRKSPEWMLGKSLRDLLGPRLHGLNLPYIERALAGERQMFEREIPDPNGCPSRHAMAEYIPHFIDGKPCGFFAYVTDISARVAIENQLRDKETKLLASKRRLRELLSASSAVIYTCDPEVPYAFTFLSANIGSLLGYEAAPLLEDPGAWVRLIHPDDLAGLFRLRRSLSSDEKQVSEYRLRNPDGSYRWIRDEVKLALDAEGRPKELIGFWIDISERKRVERLQSEFVSTVSHELRTPLTSIRGALGLVAGGVTGVLPTQAKSCVDIALSNAERLVRLTDDILDIEKLDAGVDFRMETLALGAMVGKSVADAFALPRNVRLRLTGTPPRGDVVVDRDRLAQVMTNLISNAAKFSPTDGIIDVDVRRSGTWMRVEIRDYGPGVPESFRSRIFQRFAQADSSETRARGGTGLGLSICKAIVERMRGRIGFESADGGGSRFYFELPVVAELEANVEPQGGGLRVLVCEDDPDAASLQQSMFRDVGASVHLATTRDHVAQLLRRFEYDLITLDPMLGAGSGAALIQEIRDHEAARKVPLMVLTASSFQQALKEGAMGVAFIGDVLMKPPEEGRLKEAIDTALSPGREGAARILVVSDDDAVRESVRRLVAPGCTLVEVGRFADASTLLARASFDLVMIDLVLPDGSGDRLLTQVGCAQVILFSANAVAPALARKISAALVEGRVSRTLVRATIAGRSSRFSLDPGAT